MKVNDNPQEFTRHPGKPLPYNSLRDLTFRAIALDKKTGLSHELLNRREPYQPMI
jgi:hypothetical protein